MRSKGKKEKQESKKDSSCQSGDFGKGAAGYEVTPASYYARLYYKDNEDAQTEEKRVSLCSQEKPGSKPSKFENEVSNLKMKEMQEIFQSFTKNAIIIEHLIDNMAVSSEEKMKELLEKAMILLEMVKKLHAKLLEFEIRRLPVFWRSAARIMYQKSCEYTIDAPNEAPEFDKILNPVSALERAKTSINENFRMMERMNTINHPWNLYSSVQKCSEYMQDDINTYLETSYQKLFGSKKMKKQKSKHGMHTDGI
jgi:mevalonate kinase